MPKLPPKPCTTPRCPKMAVKRGKCEDHQPKDGWTKWSKEQGTTKQRGYGKRWERIRRVVLRRDKHLCQECLRNGIFKAGNQCDHIKPKSEGGTDELDNLQILCENCHKQKTLLERKQNEQ